MKKIEVEFWHTTVEITQVPSTNEMNNEDFSWLSNPFGDSRVYGVKYFIDDENFSWQFFLRAESKKEANNDGICLLAYLMEIYPGLNGKVHTRPITDEELDKKKLIFELVFPPPSFNKKIFLLKKIINLFNFNRNHRIQVYILWQKDDSRITEIEGTELESELELDENYKIKIFLDIDSNLINSEESTKLLELKSYLEYLTTDIRNVYGKRAYLKQVSSNTWSKILEGRPFHKNLLNENTGRFYRRILEDIPEDAIPGFINPEIIDFNIPNTLPIEKANILPKENIGFSSLSHEMNHRILLGNIYHNGVKTERKAYLHLKDFIHHLFISGLTGVGKSRFLAFLLDEFRSRAPKVGVLIINLLKKDEEGLFDADIVLQKGGSQFRIPYFIEGEDLEQTLEQVAGYIIASLGLKNIAVTNMENALSQEMNENGSPPQKIKDIFIKLLKWFEDHPYHIKYQTNITRAIKNRVMRLVSSPFIDEILELGPIPQWFKEWQEGKNVFIDLSRFSKNGKRLLTHAIFQMIRTIMPEMRTNNLKNVIMIDEISEILEKPHFQNYDDDDTVSRHHLEIVFSAFLTAFRSRGISLILADVKPSRLFEAVYTLPNIKILFRTDKKCLQQFTLNSEEQEFISNQKGRRAFVIDGVNARKFTFHTLDSFYK